LVRVAQLVVRRLKDRLAQAQRLQATRQQAAVAVDRDMAMAHHQERLV
jgi:hypothetical protein